MDALNLNPDVLEATAKAIEIYTKNQSEIMADYLSRAGALRSEWNDDKTMGRLMEEIQLLKNNVETLMNEIYATYPPIFRKQAEKIRIRPEL